MSLHQILLRLCRLGAILVLILASTASVYSQVPANNPALADLGVKEMSLPLASHVVKVMPSESPIPFGITVASNNTALLEMKGNDQDFARRFTFKNSSTGTYTINSIDFQHHEDSFEFLSIESGESLPMVVTPGHSFTVRVAFHSKGRNVPCSNTLRFTIEENKIAMLFPIQAMQLPLSAMPWNAKPVVAQAK